MEGGGSDGDYRSPRLVSLHRRAPGHMAFTSMENVAHAPLSMAALRGQAAQQPTPADVRRGRQKQKNRKWPGPGGGGTGNIDEAAKKARGRRRHDSKTQRAVARKAQSLSPVKQPSETTQLSLPSLPQQQWWVGRSVDKGLHQEDDVSGEGDVGSAVDDDSEGAVVNIRSTMKEEYEALPPLTWRSSPSRSRQQSPRRRAGAEEGHASEEGSEGGRSTSPMDWNDRRTVLSHYRSVARHRAGEIQTRRQKYLEETVGAIQAAVKVTEAARLERQREREKEERARTRRERRVVHVAGEAESVGGKSLRQLRPRLGEILNPTDDVELADPSLQYLAVKRNAGWNVDAIHAELVSQGLLVFPERPRSPPRSQRASDDGSDHSEEVVREDVAVGDEPACDTPEDDDADAGAAKLDATAVNGDQGQHGDTDMRENMEEAPLVLPAIEGATLEKHAPYSGSSSSSPSPSLPSDIDDDDSEDEADAWEGRPTLWTHASYAPQSLSTSQPTSGRAKAARLHPLLLLKCAVVGDKILASATQHVVAGLESPRDVGYVDRDYSNLSDSSRSVFNAEASVKQLATTVVPLSEYPLGIYANGFEELLLLEVRRSVSDWGMGPMERGLFEREIDAENRRRRLPHGLLRTRLTRVRTLPQLCQRVALVETRTGRVRQLSRGASRLDSLRPGRLYSARSRTSELAPEDSFESAENAPIAQSSASATRPAEVPPLALHKSISAGAHEAKTTDRSPHHGDVRRLHSMESFNVHFSPFMTARSDEDSDNGCLAGTTKRRTIREPRRELTFNLAHTILSNYDVPGILHVMECHGRQIFKLAVSAAKVSVDQSSGSLPELLATERRIAARLIDSSWPVLVHSSRSSMEDAVNYHSILSNTVESLSSRTLKTLSITRLIITGSEIDDGGIASLVLGLRGMPALKALDLSDNPYLTWRCCIPLSELLDTRHRPEFVPPKHRVIGCGDCFLDTLVLNGLCIGERGVELLAPKLHRNKHLMTLSIQRVGLMRRSALAISLMLQENITLQELRLGWNQISATSAESIALSLSANRSLLRFELSNTGLGEGGGAFFALALQENTVLREFDLSSNSIGARTCLVLGEALQRNNTLKVLILDGNPLGEEGGTHLVSALSRNTAVQRLGLQSVSFVDVVELEAAGFRKMLFNRAKPNGHYDLNLQDPAERQIAVELVRLRAKSGPTSWHSVYFNGHPFHGPAEKDGWPERMPEKGRLELTYDADLIPLLFPEAVPAHTFEVLMQEMEHSNAVDFWRLGLVKTAVSVTFFTAEQAIRLLGTFQWSADRVEAAILLFVRVVDSQNLHRLTQNMTTDEHRHLFGRLGMAAYLRSENPTGRYHLNLSRQLERVIAQRLLMQAQAERLWRTSPVYVNFRNVVLQGENIDITDPINFVIPATGFMRFDFIVYDKGLILETLHKRHYALRRRPRPIDGLNFLRLVGAVQSVKELEAVLEAQARGLQHVGSFPDVTPRSTGPRLMNAVKAVMMKQNRTQDKDLFDRIARSGRTLREMLDCAEASGSAVYEHAQTSDTTATPYAVTRVQSAHFRDIVSKVDREAEEMALEMAKAEEAHAKRQAQREMRMQRGGSSDVGGSRMGSLNSSLRAVEENASLRLPMPERMASMSIQRPHAMSLPQRGASDGGAAGIRSLNSSLRTVDELPSPRLAAPERAMSVSGRIGHEEAQMAAAGMGGLRMKGKQGLRNVVGRINALNMMHQGMASVFDLSIPNVSPLALVRSFGNSHFCTCQQLLQLVCVFDRNIPQESTTRVAIAQVLFPRIVDLEHFGDILRNFTPIEQVHIMRRVGFLNCVYTFRGNFFHLHGVCFIIRMSVEEECRAAKILAHYVEGLPKTPMTGQSVRPVFNHLLINGSPASMSEDNGFCATLCTLAQNRPRPDDSWDPMGTLEFQLRLPELECRRIAAGMIQRAWRGFLARRVAMAMQDEQITDIQASSAAMSVAGMLVGRAPSNFSFANMGARR